MGVGRDKRRLAAILVADVVGYSRLMGADESGTLAQLKAHRKELIDPKIEECSGRIFKTTGDGVLVEFRSVVDAVQCAVEVQRAMASNNVNVPEDRRIEYRIGINLGDVIVEGDDIFGDGVNVAARLEPLAEPGGVCISGSTRDQVRDKLALVFEDMGEQSVKNILRPVRAFQIRPETLAPQAVESASAPAELPDQSSIAVLPFDNMSGDPEQEYFSDGISEDIITDLSKISALFVIARNSAFKYKGKALDVTQVSRELGVSYILEGSVRKARNQVRITAQLVDGATGGHLWAERYDRDLDDIFAVQDEVTQKIVTALQVKLTEPEQRKQVRGKPGNVEAYDTLLRGREQFLRFTKEGNSAARRLYEKALELDPKYSAAYAALAQSYLLEGLHGWTSSPGEARKHAFDLAIRALDLDPSLPSAHDALSGIYLFQRKHDQAIVEAKVRMALEPNSADGYAILAQIQAWAGRPEEALELIEKAITLNPHYPTIYAFSRGHAYFLMHCYQKAASAFQEGIRLNPEFSPNRSFLGMTYAKLGEVEKARSELEELMRIHPELATMSEEESIAALPYRRPEDTQHFLEGMAAMGQ